MTIIKGIWHWRVRAKRHVSLFQLIIQHIFSPPLHTSFYTLLFFSYHFSSSLCTVLLYPFYITFVFLTCENKSTGFWWTKEIRNTFNMFKQSYFISKLHLKKVFGMKIVKTIIALFLIYLGEQRQNLKNLSRDLNPPKPGLNWAPA